MILLYTMMLLLLGVARLLIGGRARSLEKRYAAVARQVLHLAHEPAKGGNSSKPDAFVSAKRTYELGRLVQKRDFLEAKYYGWRGVADRLTGWMNAVRQWKGQKLPYTLGVLDVWLALYVVDQLGVGEYLSLKQVVENVLARLQ